jgi:xanthine dehydrogenase accessory factor
MAQVLVTLAEALDWRAVMVDGADFTAADVDERSLVVVATQGHYDEEALEQAVAARPAYLGLVGSRRRGESVLGYLADRGLPAEQLGQVHVPAGLDLGKVSHREIAVAILADLVRLRASGALTTEVEAPAEAVDPVCGMTVAARDPVEHDGVAYYFCCPGCRAAFEQEPAAYAKKESRC